MDAQDIRNLQEAYLEVYDEAYDPKGQGKLIKKMSSLAKPDPDSTVKQNQKRRERSDKMYSKHYTSYVRPKSMPGGIGGPEWKSRKNKEKANEQVDIYDIILSHLLDEGYAETQEAAEVIMVNMSEDWRDSIVEATAMAKRGHDEASIRQRIAQSTGGGEAADRARALADRPTYGDEKSSKARQRLARIQVGDFRKTTSSSPGLHGYAHKSDDPEVKAKQAARGAQRGALTPREKKQLGR